MNTVIPYLIWAGAAVAVLLLFLICEHFWAERDYRRARAELERDILADIHGWRWVGTPEEPEDGT